MKYPKIFMIYICMIFISTKIVIAENSSEKIIINMNKKIEQNIKDIENFHVVNKGKFKNFIGTLGKYSEILGKTHKLIDFTKNFCPKYKICFLDKIQQRKMAISDLNKIQKKLITNLGTLKVKCNQLALVEFGGKPVFGKVTIKFGVDNKGNMKKTKTTRNLMLEKCL